MRDVARVPLEGQDGATLEAALEAARARHARHYCDVLATADDLYLKGGQGVLAGLALYDLEQRNIAAGQAWAAARIEQGRCRRAASRPTMPTPAGISWSLRLHPRERIDWLEAQRRACVRLGDRRGEGNALGNLGNAWADLGEPRRAIELLRAAPRDRARDRRPARRGQRARQSGHRLGGPRRAAAGDRASTSSTSRSRARSATGAARAARSAIWASPGRTSASRGGRSSFYEQHLAIAREIGDRRGEGNALGNLGTRLGEPRRAAAGDRALRAAPRDRARDRRPARRGQRAVQLGLWRSMRLASGTTRCGGCARRSPSTRRSGPGIWSRRRARSWPSGARRTGAREAASLGPAPSIRSGHGGWPERAADETFLSH